MAARRKGRILAFQALYCWEASGGGADAAVPQDILDFVWDERAQADAELAAFSRLLLTGAVENIRAVDAMIRRHLTNWDFSRVNRVDLAVLRLSVYTLMYQRDMAPSIVINEAIGISKEFGGDDSYRFINGVLDSIRLTLLNYEEERSDKT